MKTQRYLDIEAIHHDAVIHARAKGFYGEAGRLAAADVGKHIKGLLDSMKPAAWELPDETIMHGIAMRLWSDWLTVELRDKK